MKNPWAGLRGLPRQAWLVCVASLVNRTGTMVLPFLVLYLTRELGLSPRAAGLGLAVYGVGSLITTPLAGRLCDRVGALRIMRFSLLVSGLVLFFLPLARGLSSVLAATFLWSVVSEGVRPASFTLLSQVVPPAQRKPAFALLRLAVNLGMSIGPALGGVLATVSFPALFWVDGATSVAAGLVLVLVPWEAPRARRHTCTSRPTAVKTWRARCPRIQAPQDAYVRGWARSLTSGCSGSCSR